MLTKQEVAYRITAAMDGREPPVPSAWLARKCGVTPQAVYKWRTKGEIDLIEHIHALSDALKVPPEYFIEKRRGESRETGAVWKTLGSWLSKAAIVLLFVAGFAASNPAQAASHNAYCHAHSFANYLTKLHIVAQRLLRRLKMWIKSSFPCISDAEIA